MPGLLKKDRPIRDVPRHIVLILIFALILQLCWHSLQKPVTVRAEDLPRPMSTRTYILTSMGEPIAISKLLNLWLQAFDNQPGISIPFTALDYSRIQEWLDTILELDPQGVYPMLVAARVYGSVSDKKRKRKMMDYIYYKFLEDPNLHWQWLAHAVITAKHELKDLELALKYSSALSELAVDENVPYWARDMKVIVLEDMGEVEAAKVLVGALIESGKITDNYELLFLTEKIRVLEEKLANSQQNVEISSEKP